MIFILGIIVGFFIGMLVFVNDTQMDAYRAGLEHGRKLPHDGDN